MKLAFDAESILATSHSGIGWVAINLMEAAATLKGDDELQLQYFLPRREYDKPTVDRLAGMGFKPVTSRFHGTLYKMIWRFIPLGYSRFFGRADATCFFNFHLPPGVKGKKVVFVHDMTYKKFPDTVRWKTLFMLRLNMNYTIKHADRIIAVSEFTKAEIMKYYDIPAERIEVVYNAVNTTCFHTGYTREQAQAAGEKYGIEGEYLLYLGNLEPRKNIERMIDAYRLMRGRVESPPKFVLAGSKGWMYEGIFERVRQLGLEKEIIFTGYIGRDDAPLLMRGALGFVFVSLYEGFGIPPLEAMACGTPVLTSNAASLPEATGGRALYADPTDVENIADGMKKLVVDAETRQRLCREGPEWVKNFSWEKSARKLLDIMRQI